MATPPVSTSVTTMYAASAGLDLVSGVFGYLTSLNAASIAQSRADMIRMESEANAQRYAERAQADIAQQKMMYLASGVTLSGSPIDVLDTHARIASENMASIRMHGAAAASDEEQMGENALTQGRNALLGGVAKASQDAAKPAWMSLAAQGGGANTGFGAEMARAMYAREFQ